MLSANPIEHYCKSIKSIESLNKDNIWKDNVWNCILEKQRITIKKSLNSITEEKEIYISKDFWNILAE